MKVNPEHEALFQAALADRNGDRPRAAIRKFRALLRQNNEIPNAYLLLGDIQSDLGYHAAAVTSFSRAVRLRPQRSLCSVGLIHALLDKGDFNGALKEVNRFLKIKESKEHRELLDILSDLSEDADERREFMAALSRRKSRKPSRKPSSKK